ncbi:hypothetical protein [Absidia glauca]|uniref:Uncharacterized protein n=1 Tax=Absidia glauca TaxID=4829 RepID=A0A163J5W0_ABSGL|nr:hypothetical protein [Absidia glauca]
MLATRHKAKNHLLLVVPSHMQQPLISSPITASSETYTTPQTFVNDLTSSLDNAYNIVLDHQRSYNDSLLSNIHSFSINDLVLIKQLASSHAKQRQARKLLIDWIGPFAITKVRSRTTYDIKDEETSKAYYNVHISRIKSYISSPV